MVTVTIKDGKFVIHGSFDFGYMGIYHDDEILILRPPRRGAQMENGKCGSGHKNLLR
ncbi:hypothetical protein SAMN04487832_12819 [Ruminococcus sp. XPD3002]|nr:hypothetical protein SAMN04487832_12819 [Ruminococcus flavefaciens]